MSKFLTTLILCLPFIIICQPTITSSVHQPKLGQSFNTVSFAVEEDSVIVASPGDAGINKTWNFSKLNKGNEILSTYIDPNTLALKDLVKALDVNMGLKTVDEDGLFVVLMNVSNTQIVNKGLTNDTIFVTSDPAPVVMKFPFRFGDKFNTRNGLKLGDSLEFLSVRSQITTEADAYGSITTADGVFDNVLRVRSFSIDSVTISFGPDFGFNTVDTSITYLWYAANRANPVFQLETTLVEGKTVIDAYSFSKSKTTNTELTAGENIEIYPNPFQDKISIKSSNQSSQYTLKVFDNIGRKVVERILDDHKAPNMDLSNLPSGPYTIQISNPSGLVKVVKVVKQ